ncbi:structural protein P5 [Paraburkholderia unamae]|uniref:structural protein P5 n=1 Tax=Paraburkholderia unamae TaxID=219649 RepID=UPI001CC4F2B2|nr:structural protein P5 [Paraburkholderia unamae]
MATQNPPRGIRNNNPGNIRHSGARWAGQSAQQGDTNFVTFDTPEHGIRALARIVLNYQSHHRLHTIEEIIHRWAPPSENNTNAYAQSVARAMGISRNQRVNLEINRHQLFSLVSAIIRHENGSPNQVGRAEWYSREAIENGISLALQAPPQPHKDRSVHHVHHRHNPQDAPSTHSVPQSPPLWRLP